MIFILHLGAVASERIAYNLWYECENQFGKRISFYNILIWQQHQYMIPTHPLLLPSVACNIRTLLWNSSGLQKAPLSQTWTMERKWNVSIYQYLDTWSSSMTHFLSKSLANLWFYIILIRKNSMWLVNSYLCDHGTSFNMNSCCNYRLSKIHVSTCENMVSWLPSISIKSLAIFLSLYYIGQQKPL